MKNKILVYSIKVGDIVEWDNTMLYTITEVNRDKEIVNGVAIGGGQSKITHEEIPISEITKYYPLTEVNH